MIIVALDDERLGLSKLVTSLKKIVPNAEVVEFTSSKKAVEYLNDNSQIDALYTDIDMPVMNGIEVANHFRKLNELAKIVFVSGDKKHQEEALKISNTKYVLKPYSVEELQQTMIG